MPDAELCILSTRLLEQSLVEKAAAHGIIIETVPFIHTQFLPEEDLSRTITSLLQQSCTIVFTSVQAVISVSRFYTDSKPDWRIYCLNEATFTAVQKYFGIQHIAGTATDSAALAALIAADHAAQEIVFFCGNKRKDTIPQILSRHHKTVQEIIVYTTEATPQKVEKQYSGIAFFSPSAVDSFFSVNEPQHSAKYFAIGNTTAAALGLYIADTNKILTSTAHTAAALLQLITDTLHAYTEK